MIVTESLRVVHATYTTADNRTVIEIFGRDKDGKSYTVLYNRFLPYCHIEKNDMILKSIQDLYRGKYVAYKEVTLEYLQEKIECYKVWFRFPWCVGEVRKRFEDRIRFFSADILFALRFWYDTDLGAYITFEGERIVNNDYTTDFVVEATKVWNCDDPFKPKLSVLSFDIETSKDWKEIKCITASLRRVDGTRKDYKLVGDLPGIIREFEEIFYSEDPDIITGYNIDNFDFPRIDEICRKNELRPPRIGRDRSEARQRDKWWRMKGRIVIDAWWKYHVIKRPKKEKLADAAHDLLGKAKIDVNPSKIDEEWTDDPIKVINYCQTDSELALEILEELKVIQDICDTGQISRLPLNKSAESKTSQLIDGRIVRVFDRGGFAVPCNRYGAEEQEKIEGGYVHKVVEGLHNWVVILDFKSLYPSIVIDNNICFTTFTPDGSGPIKSPVGASFLSPEMRKGILPQILSELGSERDAYKKLRDETDDKGWKDYYNRLQDKVKVLMNGMYGVFASQFYRFTLTAIGASITAFARAKIKHIIQILESEGFLILIADTDSAFIKSPFHSIEKCIIFGRNISARFSTKGYILEFEYTVEWLLAHGAKKRYIAKVVWPIIMTLTRGYETRRTDAFDAMTDTMTESSDLILDGKRQKGVKVAMDAIAEVKAGQLPPEKFVISKTCKSFNRYKNPDNEAQVRAAKMLIDAGYQFTPGAKVSYIVTNGSKTPQEVAPFIPDDTGRRCTPDYGYYAHRMAKAIARITSVIGYGEEDLLTGTRQMTLEGFDGRAEI